MNAPWEKDEIIPDGGTASPWEQDEIIESAPEEPQPGVIKSVGNYLAKPFIETGKFIGQEAKRIGENVSAPTTLGRNLEPGSTAELYAGIPERVGRVVGGVGGSLARGAAEALTPIMQAGVYGAKQTAKGIDAVVPGTPMRDMRDDIVQDFTPIVTKAKPFVEAGIEKYGQYKESLPESERANLEAAEGMAEFLGAFMPIRAIEKPVEQFGKQLVKDLAKKPEAAVEKAAAQFDKAAEIGTSKGIKPTVVGKPSLAKMTGFYNKVNKAAQTIAEQKDAIRILDENGEQVSHPRSSAEMAQAIDQAKKNVFKQYNDMSVAAGEGGVRLSIKPIDEKLLKITGNVPEELQGMIPQWEKTGGVPQGIVLPDKKFNPDVRSYAARLREEIRELDGQSPEIIEARIADLNASLKNFYANPDRVGAAKAQVDASVAQALREELDNMITSAEGPGYKELKGKYGALKAIEKEVNKRALVNARRATKGIYDMTDIFTGGEILSGLISGHPGMVVKGATGFGIKALYKWLNNPDRYIEKMFDRAYKLEDAKRGIRPPEPPTTPGGAPVPKSVVPDTPREAAWKEEVGKTVRPPRPVVEPSPEDNLRSGLNNEDGFISLPGGRPNPPSPIDPGPGGGTPRPSRPAPGGGTAADIPQSNVEANKALIGRLQAEATDRARRNELDFMQREAEEINNWEKQFGNDYIWTEGLPIGEAKYVKRGTPEETWYQSRLAAIRDEEAVARQGRQDQGAFQKSRQSPRTEPPAPVQRPETPTEPITAADAGSVRPEPAAAPADGIRGGRPSEPSTLGEPPRAKMVGTRKASNTIDVNSYKELAEHPNREISQAFDEAMLGYEFYREIYTDPTLRRAMGVDRLAGPVSKEAKAYFDEQMRILSGETRGTLDPEVEKMLTAKAEAINMIANDPANAGERSIRLFGDDGQVHADDIKGLIESAPRTYGLGNRQIISKRAFDIEMNKLRRQVDDEVEPPPREEPAMVGAESDIPIVDGEPMFSRKSEPRMDLETAKETARSNGLEYVTSTPAPGGPFYTFRDPRSGTEFKATTRSEVRQAMMDLADNVAPKGTVKAGDRVAFSRKSPTPEQVAKENGLRYKGKWENGPHEFYDPETGGNISDTDLSRIASKAEESRAAFKKEPTRESAEQFDAEKRKETPNAPEMQGRKEGEVAFSRKGPDVEQLKKTLKDVEDEFEELREARDKGTFTREAFDKEWESVEKRAAAIRRKLFDLTGDPYGISKESKLRKKKAAEKKEAASKSVLDQISVADEEYGTEIVDYPARGFLLPDGNYLSIGSGSDHRSINGMVDLGKKLEDKYESERTDKMLHIMRQSGAIRFIPESQSFHLETNPTSDQTWAISRYIRDNGSAEVEFPNGKSNRYTEDNLFELEEDIERGNIAFSRKSADPFFSPTMKAVQGLKQERGTGDQMFAMITKTPGVKEAEWKWMGLDDFLKGKQSVTRQEIEEFVRGNQVRVEEVEKGKAQFKSPLSKKESDRLEELSQATDLNIAEEQEFDDLSLRVGNAKKKWEEETGGKTKFSQYTLPGGENYREVLLTLPVKKGADELPLEWRKNRQDLWAWFKGDKQVSGAFKEYDARNAAMPTITSKPLDKNRFKSSHWDEPNVIAHIRMNDRTGPNGEKVLFIEEIQSDWAREARDKGVIDNRILDVEPVGLPTNAYRLVINGIPSRGEYIFAGSIEEARLKIPEALKRRGEHHEDRGVPAQPFLKNWEELTMKRILRLASEEGYDRVAWINGEQTAARYDLSKQISRVTYQPDKKRLQAYSTEGTRVIDEIGVEPERVAEYIGKEPARRLLEQPVSEGQWVPEQKSVGWLIKKPDGTYYETEPGRKMVAENKGQAERIAERHSGKSEQMIEGENLKIGGEWAANLYDRMIPKFYEKYGKKWGTKVEEVSIGKGDSENEASLLELSDGTYAIDYNGDRTEYDTEQAARSALKEIRSGQMVQQSIPITPEMKESVLYEGQPMFQRTERTPRNLPEKQFRPAKSSDQNAARALARPAGEALGRPLTPDDIRAVEPFDTEARNAAAALRKITNMPVVFVQTSDAMKAAGIDFNGVHFGGRIFLNVDNEHPYLITGFHEAWEGIKKNHGDLVEPLIDHVVENLTPEGRRAANLRALSEKPEGTPTEADIRNAVKENLFDFGADQMSKPEWWTSLYEKSPEAVRRIVQDVIAHINKFLADLKIRKLDNSQHYKDAMEIRDRMKGVHAEVLKREFGEDGAKRIAGDMAEFSRKAGKADVSKQTTTPEFKKWFGDSKVVDAEGKPLVVYHGTKVKDNFTVFDPSLSLDIKGIHFGDAETASDFSTYYNGGRIIPAYISMKKPFITKDYFRNPSQPLSSLVWQLKKELKIDDLTIEKMFDEARSAQNKIDKPGSIKVAPRFYNTVKKILVENGFDGIIYKNNIEGKGSKSYAVFSPTQIKSATGNRGTFDPENPDIRFSRKTAK